MYNYTDSCVAFFITFFLGTWEKPTTPPSSTTSNSKKRRSNKKTSRKKNNGGSEWEEYEWAAPTYDAQQEKVVLSSSVEQVIVQEVEDDNEVTSIESEVDVFKNQNQNVTTNAKIETDWNALEIKSPMKRKRGNWSEHLDLESGAYWYYNDTTEEHTWIQPNEWNTQFQSNTNVSEIDQETNWSSLESTSPIKQKRGHWSEHLDHESGAYWYYNEITEEHTWERPVEWPSTFVEEQFQTNKQNDTQNAKEKENGFSKNETTMVPGIDYATPRNQPIAKENTHNNQVTHPQIEQTKEVAEYWNDLKMTSPLKQKRGKWSEHIDEETNTYWYHNNETNESSWNPPNDWEDMAGKYNQAYAICV